LSGPERRWAATDRRQRLLNVPGLFSVEDNKVVDVGSKEEVPSGPGIVVSLRKEG
jgi:hypothetical protein